MSPLRQLLYRRAFSFSQYIARGALLAVESRFFDSGRSTDPSKPSWSAPRIRENRRAGANRGELRHHLGSRGSEQSPARSSPPYEAAWPNPAGASARLQRMAMTELDGKEVWTLAIFSYVRRLGFLTASASRVAKRSRSSDMAPLPITLTLQGVHDPLTPSVILLSRLFSRVILIFPRGFGCLGRA